MQEEGLRCVKAKGSAAERSILMRCEGGVAAATPCLLPVPLPGSLCTAAGSCTAVLLQHSTPDRLPKSRRPGHPWSRCQKRQAALDRTWPFCSLPTAASTSGPMQSSTFSTVVPSSSLRRGTTGVSRNLSSGPSFGRPCAIISRRESRDCICRQMPAALQARQLGRQPVTWTMLTGMRMH